jgi:lactate 2-monooxygenase
MTKDQPQYGPSRQSELYAREGPETAIPLQYTRLKREAEATLDANARAFVSGGAGGEDTISANRRAFDRWRLVPRVLCDIAERDLRVELFDETLPVPVLLAPIGMQSLAHEDAEVATARAAASLDVPMVLSSTSSASIEDVADALGETTRWFQLYRSSDDDLTASFLDRAASAGYSAVVLTVDTPVTGWRERELEQGPSPWLEGEGVANYLSDPVFRAALDAPPEEDPDAASQYLLDVFGDPSFTWDDLTTVRELTDLPLLLKGIVHPDDAQRAVEAGVDGIIVSNHGGRQVDGAIAALDALPDIVTVVDGRVPVLFDSGIRRGADIVKALALGADAILLGRPYIYGLALEGEVGVRAVLKNILADLDFTLGLCGCRSVATVDESVATDHKHNK